MNKGKIIFKQLFKDIKVLDYIWMFIAHLTLFLTVKILN
jgi:hypothetical protein